MKFVFIDCCVCPYGRRAACGIVRVDGRNRLLIVGFLVYLIMLVKIGCLSPRALLQTA